MTYHIYSLADSRMPEAVRYIGYTKHGERRLSWHLNAALCENFQQSHKNNWIRKVVDEGGTILFRPLCIVADALAAKVLEVEAIRNYKRHGHPLVNGTEGGDGSAGWDHKIGDALRGRTHVLSPEGNARRLAALQGEATREKMREAALKRIARDPEHLERMRATRGPITDEYRAKMSAVMTGKPKSAEHAAKVGAAHKGRPKSAEQRAKISATKKGNSPVPPEMRAQISAKMTGVPKSEETRARMREAQQKRFAEKRARAGIEPT